MNLEIGSQAPDLILPDQHGAEFSLAALRGQKAVLLVFYPFAFSGVCNGELTGFRDHLEKFETERTTIAAISCDPMFALRAYADRDALFFPLLSDFWPHGEVSRAFGVFDDQLGCSTRSSYVIDAGGVVRWAIHSPMGVARDLDEQARQLAQVV
ncbi:MAG TPA: peroxiredoxin [Marmoricola sp.]|nr:peroxiredoxin [Marmoricola sp.]HNN47772.1 peroxiredoxin [Marmoricola sp.]